VLPYIHIPSIHLVGKLEIQPFGILVASGVLFGSWLARKYAERFKMDEEVLRYLGIRLLVVGFIACHLFNTFFYEWDRLVGNEPLLTTQLLDPAGTTLVHHARKIDWLLLINPLDGIASWGGVLGGFFAFMFYSRRLKLDRLAWADCLSWGVAGGWVLGRAACAVAHDHMGHPTDFPLAVKLPTDLSILPGNVQMYAGKAVHDLGLYEFFILVPILVVVLVLGRVKNRKPGLLIGVLGVLYSAPRFFLDYLRQEGSDPRYFGLTFAQYCSAIAFVGALALVFWPRRAQVAEAVAAAAEAEAAEPKPAANPRSGKRNKRK
jgi:phosphatidylglycerol:prolipoprotein diacylglycerol transferase